MFPSSFNNSDADPINYQRTFFTDITCRYPLDPSSLFNFSSDPLFNPCFGDLFQPVLQENLNMAESEMDKAAKQILATRKRCAKRDRHSKIDTARGPRDRRMRLSLKVAREFFDLQDKLCFDKASKTVEWLLNKSDSAIKQLSGNQSASSPSECEVISGTNEEEDDEEAPPLAATKDTLKSAAKTVSGGTFKKKGKKAKLPSRKTALNRQDKESREKARAKAKERTREKQKLLSKKIESEEANKINQLSCWSTSDNPIETVEESVTQSHSLKPCEAPATFQLPAAESISNESFEKWSPFPCLRHLYNPGFLQEQNEITPDFQFC